MQVLTHVFPQGPEPIGCRKDFNFTEKDTPLHVATQSASGTYPAPWTAAGFIAPNEGGGLQYKFNFSWPNRTQGAKQGSVDFAGTLNVRHDKQGLDYGTTSRPKYETLSEAIDKLKLEQE